MILFEVFLSVFIPIAMFGKLRALFYFYPVLLFLTVSACNNNRGPGSTEKKPDAGHRGFKAGEMTDTVKCSNDTSFTYALYLPKSYTVEKEFPVLFFFDAHKRGKLPVKKYKSPADKYGYILAGSYNSTNGQSRAEMDNAISMMMDDVFNRFNINRKRVYTGGFSGGARVAAYAALFKRKVAGTVGCAAGFPQITTQPNTGFAYIALVGNKDFNYLELKNLDRSLQGSGIRHFLRVYDGKHDWPPEQIMEEAFLFFQFDAMRNKLIPVDKSLIRKFKEENNDSIESASNNRNWLRLAFWLNRAVVYLDGIDDVEKEKEALAGLKRNPQYQKHLQEEIERGKTEHDLQQSYVRAMENREKDWWVNKINDLIAASENSNDKDQKLMNTRLLNYLSLVSYMYATRALQSNDTETAEKYLTIYEMVDPENPEVYYLKAVRFAKLKKDKEALTELQKAAGHHFHDYSRMAHDKNFTTLKTNPAFQDVLEKVRQNSEKE